MLRRPCFLVGAGAPSSSRPPLRGVERRKALVRNAAPRGPPRGRTDLRFAGDRRPMTLAGAPLGAPPRHFARPKPRFSSGPGFRAWHLRRTRPASTSQSGRNAARHDARSRPSAWLRATPAGAAPWSIFKTSLEDAPRDQGGSNVKGNCGGNRIYSPII